MDVATQGIAATLEAPIRVLVVDDEPTARQRMLRLLGSVPGVTVVGVCGSGREALDAVERHEPELVFLDISMPGLDGMEVARRLSPAQGGGGPLVVFVTAYDEHALEAFRVRAADYVLKPIDQARLREALEHARVSVRRMRAERSAAPGRGDGGGLPLSMGRFAIRDGHRTHLVPVADLLWVESFGNYARVYTPTTRYIHRATMAAIAEQLAPYGFVRIHRTVIVNSAHVTQLRPRGSGQYEVTLDMGTRLRVSRTFRNVLEALRQRRA